MFVRVQNVLKMMCLECWQAEIPADKQCTSLASIIKGEVQYNKYLLSYVL